MSRYLTVLVALLMTAASPVSGQIPPDAGAPLILQAKPGVLHLRLLDVVSATAIAGAPVEVEGDNGVRCIRAPCPTDTRTWRGRTDAAGRVDVPTTVLMASGLVKTPGHFGDLIRDSRPDSGDGWLVEMYREDTTGMAPHPFQLIDPSNGRPITGAPVRVTYRRHGGGMAALPLRSNALGYIFVPVDVIAGSEDDVWVEVPGYRRTRLDFAWVRRRTRLARG